ncbi:FtsX-like permease family protein [Allohahella marinimesophila]|uniref:ABC transporter permease n=1 Tax=Allohahella marinimesophila TaxID=1054972 RepID=A0ABP7NQ84_9GAMM
MSIRRELRQPAFRIVFYSLCVMCLMLMLMMRLNVALVEKFAQGQRAMAGGDVELDSNRQPEPADKWTRLASETGLAYSETYEFSTMAAVEDRPVAEDPDLTLPEFQLVSVKAVDQFYPLEGQLDVETRTRAPGDGENAATSEFAGPPPGEVYLARTLFERLGVEFGSKIRIGRAVFEVGGRLLSEPDPSFRIVGAAPRVLMNFADVPSTEIILPGSRYDYEVNMSGSPDRLSAFEAAATPMMGASDELEWANSREGTLSRAWERSSAFLALAALATILITLVSLQLALELYVMQQQRIVALQRTLGMTSDVLLRDYLAKLGMGLVLALTFGWLASLALERGLFALLGEQVSLPASPLFGWWVLLPAGVVAFVCLFQWYPQLRSLLQAPPASLLRQSEDGSVASSKTGRLWTLTGYALLVVTLALYLGSTLLVVVVMALFLVPLLLAGLLFLLARVATKSLSGDRHVIYKSAWRSALANILRRPWWVIPQTAALGGTFGLLLTVFLIRTELITQWTTQLPDDAPNHFLINIAPYEREELESLIQETANKLQPMYPLIRGRLAEINGEDVKTTVSKEKNVNALNRELNLTWSAELPDSNQVADGEWWTDAGGQLDPGEGSPVRVSIESLLAQQLDLDVGDSLVFDIGSERLETVVSSLRTVDWTSLKPNFYVIFEPGALEAFTPSYITSFRVGDEHSADLLSQINRNYPTVSILELGPLISRIQVLLKQVGQGLELLLAIVIAAAALVVVVVMLREAPVRAHETALMQALGLDPGALRATQRCEFFFIGCASGLLAMVLSQTASLVLQIKVFDMAPTVYWQYWLLLPIGLGVAIALYASFNLRSAMSRQPAAVLK